MKISNSGLAIIKEFEGLSLRAYKDPVGLWTIGYGHLIKTGEKFVNAITLKSAEQILVNDVVKAEKAVATLVKVPLTQNQFDALVSLTFNIGKWNLKSSTLLRKLNAGDYMGAAKEFPRWKYSKKKELPGLVRRRAREQGLFLSEDL